MKRYDLRKTEEQVKFILTILAAGTNFAETLKSFDKKEIKKGYIKELKRFVKLHLEKEVIKQIANIEGKNPIVAFFVIYFCKQEILKHKKKVNKFLKKNGHRKIGRPKKK